MARYSTKLKPKQKPKNNMMPVWLALAGFVLLLIAAFALWGNNAQTKANIEVKGAPRIKVEKEKIDHGELKLGNSVRDDIRITNVGDQPLRFTEAPFIEVKEGC